MSIKNLWKRSNCEQTDVFTVTQKQTIKTKNYTIIIWPKISKLEVGIAYTPLKAEEK